MMPHYRVIDNDVYADAIDDDYDDYDYNKVNRCLARYSPRATTTNQNDQKCRFWTKFGHFWAKNPNFYGSK